ncbi:hypothetical protein QMT39_002117 [Vibrio cholerae]|nr:hypothetical protein [Vibrio cholerae]ELW1708048.1 hypothetical protein [Vibrio cholerae]
MSDYTIAISIPEYIFTEFAKRYPNGVTPVMVTVLEDFLDRTADFFEPLTRQNEGIHWGNLFLPNGTQIRTRYYGEYLVADITNNAIVWNGDHYSSIAQVTNSMRGDTSNNAWKVLEIKRPQDTKWQLAERLRH